MPEVFEAIYNSSNPAWQDMLATCEAAQESIQLEEYILEPDDIGGAFTDVLIRKAAEGVKVQLLIDWAGSFKMLGSKHLKRLKESGVEVRFFNSPSLKWIVPTNYLPRDHRKILVVDGKTAFTGGVCVYDEITHWRDTMVKVENGLCQELQHIFEQTWRKISHKKENIEAHPSFGHGDHTTVYANAPDSDENFFTEELLKQMKAARHSIKITTPYFTPGDTMMPMLLDAVARGVNVQVLLSDYSRFSPYVVGKYRCGKLLRHGVKVYYYKPCMLHAKTIIIDGEWAAVGSCNIDGLSLYNNQEAMIVSRDKGVVNKLMEHFAQDIEQSERYNLAKWKKRPLKEKIGGYLLSPLAKWL